MARAPDAPVGRGRALLAEYWPLAALALLAAAISVVVHHTVFPAYSWNRDEVVYLWQVQGLAEGKALTSTDGLPLVFQPWLSGIVDNQYFSQYTLGWPLVLLAGDLLLGSASAAMAFGAALAVVGTYAFAREITRDRRHALVAAGVLVLSPVLVVQSGMYLGYLFSLGLGALFGASLLAGLRRGRWWLLVVSGVLVGWLFMTRPFDGVLWGAAVVLYTVIVSWREKRALVRALAWAALGFLPLLVATLAYNRHITGSFTEFPITAADARDNFGFGLKSLGERWTPTNFTPWIAVKGVGRNAWELPPFLFGSYVAVALTAVGLWLRRRERSTLALLAIGAVFPVGYFFFWGISLSASFANVSGPIYFVPVFLPVSILIATALLAAWRRSRALAMGVGAVLVVATAPFMVDRVSNNHSISEAQVPWRDAEAELDGRSLVIVERSGPYLLHLNPFSENTPDLDGRILYATDRGAENLDVIARYPGRRPYFERTNLTTEETLADFDLPVPRVTVQPIEVERARSFEVRTTVTATDGPVVVATLRVGGQGHQQVLSTSARTGDTFDATWRLRPGGPVPPAPGEVALVDRLGEVTVDGASGDAVEAALRRPHERVRFAYRVDGTEMEVLNPLRTYRLRELDQGLRQKRVGELDALDVTVSPAP